VPDNRPLEDSDQLYKRAALHFHDTGVTYSTDGVGRVCISGAINRELWDCLTIGWMSEADRRLYRAHFSPARVLIIASDLIRRAVLLEKDNGTKPIDPIPEKMRKGPIGIIDESIWT
jgi:hypothetical protein